MAFDRMDWHYGGDYPNDLPNQNGGTHIGMFLAWAFARGLTGEMHLAESSDALKQLQARQITGRDFLISQCDEKFWDEDLNAQGCAFAKDYYDGESSFSAQYVDYLQDYCDVFNQDAAEHGFEYASLYHIEDTWENFDKLKPILDERFDQWQRWVSNSENISQEPREQFLNACEEVAKSYLALGFKATQKGKALKKVSKDKDLTFSIVFEEDRYNTRSLVNLSVYFTIHSKKTKKWMVEQTQNQYETGLVHYGYVKQFVNQNNPTWNVAGSQRLASVEQIKLAITQQCLPVFELFEQPAQVAEFLAQHGSLFTAFSDSEIYPLAYLICMGYQQQAERFMHVYLNALPSQWRSNLKQVYQSLAATKDINLMVSECGGALEVKLAYLQGLKLNFS